jgi:hypothetical protein
MAQRRLRAMRRDGVAGTVSRMSEMLTYAVVLVVSVTATVVILWDFWR